MTHYTYRAMWQRNGNGLSEPTHWTEPEAIRVLARDIHSGWRKAMKRALKDRLKGWELVSLEFWTDAE